MMTVDAPARGVPRAAGHSARPGRVLPATGSYQARTHARGDVGATGPVTVASDGTITAWAVPSSAASESALTVCFLAARSHAVARR